jgi:hypothetical protein
MDVLRKRLEPREGHEGLQDQRVFHKNIDAVATVQADALVFDWLRVL